MVLSFRLTLLFLFLNTQPPLPPKFLLLKFLPDILSVTFSFRWLLQNVSKTCWKFATVFPKFLNCFMIPGGYLQEIWNVTSLLSPNNCFISLLFHSLFVNIYKTVIIIFPPYCDFPYNAAKESSELFILIKFFFATFWLFICSKFLFAPFLNNRTLI